MNKYESDIKKLNTSSQEAFELLSNLTNLEKAIKELKKNDNNDIEKHLKDITFDNDFVKVKSHAVGELGLRVIEREPYKTIKFETENSPVSGNVWIQLVEKSPTDTRMRLTVHANLPSMIKMMVNSKIKKGINKVADEIAKAVNKTH